MSNRRNPTKTDPIFYFSPNGLRYNHRAMEVYIELALAENFCMDFTLLYCAKLACRNRASFRRIAVAAALGACFAVAFPLLNTDKFFSVAIKLAAGVLLCAVGGKFSDFRSFLKFAAVFTGFTCALGGVLIAAFTLTGWDYSSGGGFILSSVPIGIPLFFALVLVLVARRVAAKLKKAGKTVVRCRISAGQRAVEIDGFFDSGNKVYLSGQPVSVIPLAAALKIIDENGIKEEVKIHTVAGSKKIRVFTADKIEISEGEKTQTIKNVKIGISAGFSREAVLHPDLMEE